MPRAASLAREMEAWDWGAVWAWSRTSVQRAGHQLSPDIPVFFNFIDDESTMSFLNPMSYRCS